MARFSNYAWTHVKLNANPSGAVVPPPLAGEAFLVVKTGARSFYSHAQTHVMTGANPSGAVAPPPLAGEAFLVVKTEARSFCKPCTAALKATGRN